MRRAAHGRNSSVRRRIVPTRFDHEMHELHEMKKATLARSGARAGGIFENPLRASLKMVLQKFRSISFATDERWPAAESFQEIGHAARGNPRPID